MARDTGGGRDRVPGALGAGAGASGEPPIRISVVGAGRATSEEYEMARQVGAAIGEVGGVVVTGGLGGVMEGASRGCAEAGGMAVGILPGSDAGAANSWVQLPLPTGMGEARNALVVRAGEAVVAVGGKWGTLSEIALACTMGRSVILLGTPPAELPLDRARSAREAAARALQVVIAGRRGGSAGLDDGLDPR